MVMGTGIHDMLSMTNGFKYDEVLTDLDAMKGFEFGAPRPLLVENYHGVLPNESTHLSPNGNSATSSSRSREGDSEDSEIFSDIVLTYISQMLMEEDIDEKLDMFQGHSALEATEKPFYEILGEKYPSSPDQPPLYGNHSPPLYGNHSPGSSSPDKPPLYGNHSPGSPDGGVYRNSSSNSVSSGVVNGSWAFGNVEFPSPQNYPVSVGYSSQSSFSSTNSIQNVLEGLEEHSFGKVGAPDLFAESFPAWQFMKGVEEAQKFLPSDDKLVIDLEAPGFLLPSQPKKENGLVDVKAEKEEREYSNYGSRGRKNRHSDDLDLEKGRSNKQSAVNYSEETLRSEMFDLVLLCQEEKCNKGAQTLRGSMQSEAIRSSSNGHAKGFGGGRGRGRKQSKSDMVDLRTLLIHCAQAVATDDRRSANELLKQIRQHSSPFGDGTQRLAHCFADGLEARLAGTGSEKYNSLMAKQVTATDTLKAYQLFMAACPFKKISHFFSNQMILNVTEKASRVHIIDYGIYYGFQWPCFIQRLSSRPGGPPKLRITGIEIPQPGFRPAEMVEETGRRLAEYARSFNVPFEYHAIAAKWETIGAEDLKIDKDEVLIVNCLFRFKNLADETVKVDCPRNKVLNTVRKLNPAIFIQGIVNGSYGAPFFVTRFREALFHYSAMFDMLETTVPREDTQRLLIERTILGRDALNVIACEGSERVDRPETYKQWQVRNLRAGFRQLPLDRDIMKKAAEKVKGCYHKDFVIDEDSRWLLQGWKGRITFALSAWKPNDT